MKNVIDTHNNIAHKFKENISICDLYVYENLLSNLKLIIDISSQLLFFESSNSHYLMSLLIHTIYQLFYFLHDIVFQYEILVGNYIHVFLQ